MGTPLPAAERRDVDRITAALRQHLDAELLASAQRYGSELTPESAVVISPDWRPRGDRVT